jgi:ribosome maturation factor RimP
LELRTRELVDGRRKFSGILSKCDQKYFYLKDHNKEDLTKFKFTELDICKLKPNYNNLIKEHSHAK